MISQKWVGKSLGIGEGFPGVLRAEVIYILGKKAAFYKLFCHGAKHLFVVQGTAKICRPKSAGHFLGKIGSPEFREGTSGNTS
jgi:hypothetical protein